MTRKYRLNLKQAFFIALIAAAGISGCKKYLDINQNPNNPDTAEPSLLLPTTQAAISQVIGNSFQVYGNIWAQYWTQSPIASQYKAIDQYSPLQTDFDSPWLNLYRSALINAELITKSNESGIDNIKGIAYLMKAYSYQVATDAFGNVPLSQALQPTVYRNPKYDPQQAVYDSIFMYINTALPLLKSTAGSPGIQDLIYQGNMAQWIAFANTLELRAYLRLSKADPTTAQAGIAALYATDPTFLTADATITYTSTGGNENPFYNEASSPVLAKTQNVVASSTVVNAFTRNNDPRLGKFFVLYHNNSDSLESIPQGSYLTNPYKIISPPSPLVGGQAINPASATAPVKLISAAESYFLQAEAVARGWATGNVTALYEAGITASFTATGAGDPTTYINTAPDGLPALTAAATVDDKVKAIVTQKYYAMCGFQGFEAWTEWRRTGYPTFFVASASSLLAPGQMPLRMLYPNSELTSNANYPGTVPVYTSVWWGM